MGSATRAPWPVIAETRGGSQSSVESCYLSSVLLCALVLLYWGGEGWQLWPELPGTAGSFHARAVYHGVFTFENSPSPSETSFHSSLLGTLGLYHLRLENSVCQGDILLSFDLYDVKQVALPSDLWHTDTQSGTPAGLAIRNSQSRPSRLMCAP